MIKRLIFQLLLIVPFAGFCLWLQTHTFINSNILWLMHAGAKLLAGGHYYTDFVEVNPPLCIYIYLPAVILNQFFSIGFINSIIVYLFILTIASWYFCSYLFNKLMAGKNLLLLYSFQLALAFSYFILPAYSFGEREYLLVVLVMPYLLIAVLSLSQQKLNMGLCLIAGSIAAIGFAQKPYFMPIWLGVELYLVLKTRSLKIFWRPESLACISIFILYAFLIIVITPEYITKILPLITSTYYLINKASISDLLFNPVVYFALILTVFALLLRRTFANRYLIDILLIGLLGALIIYLAQQTLWNYHLLPVYMFGSVLLALLMAEFLPRYNLANVKTLNVYFYKTVSLMLIFALFTAILLIVAIKSIAGSFFYTSLIFEQPIFKFLQTKQSAKVYIFTNDQLSNYLLLDYSQTITPSRFPSLWLIAAANDLATNAAQAKQQQFAHQIADFVRNSEAAAIMQARPDYVVVQQYEYDINNRAGSDWSNHCLLPKIPVNNHLAFFLQDKTFADFWRNYQYDRTLGNFMVYKLKSENT